MFKLEFNILFLVGRLQLEMIEPMLKTLAYMKTSALPGLPQDANFEAALQSTSPVYISSKSWKKYCEFQGEYQSRIDLLRIEKREVPVQDGADRNMPPIPTSWNGTLTTPQEPKKNVKLDLSCAFDAKRIQDYQKRNSDFENDIKLGSRLAAAKMLALMTLDIAFLKSFDVEWEAPIPALECGGAAADDDDDDNEKVDMDTSTWDVTDPASVPLKDLRIPEEGKLPAHLLYACAILGSSQVISPAALAFINRVSQRLQDLGVEYGTDSPSVILTRDLTDEEYETYNSWVLEYNKRGGADNTDDTGGNDAGATSSIVAARQACLGAVRAAQSRAPARSPGKGNAARQAAAGRPCHSPRP